jgi:nucleoside-diphosphate kinase
MPNGSDKMQQSIQEMMSERTLVLIKPDAVKRALVGVICQRFERVGMKIAACKMLIPSQEQLDGHFAGSEDWIRGMGEKTLAAYSEQGIDPMEVLGTNDPAVIGQRIKGWNFNYLSLGPVVAVVLEGVHVVATVRKMVGNTLPYKAAPGTIRGDFSINSPDLANLVGSACKNVVHASGTVDEARHEIANWFAPSEVCEWERADEFIHFVQGKSSQHPTKKEIGS